MDIEGNLRELHVDSAKKVSTVPHERNVVIPEIRKEETIQITSFVDTRFFTVEKWKVSGQSSKSLNQ
ncbi:MAG TPA: hypothetical protein VK861_06385 [Bacteroidales bacterium]|nr:hypothetical protein [Bacteroidales bacterium]